MDKEFGSTDEEMLLAVAHELMLDRIELKGDEPTVSMESEAAHRDGGEEE